MAKLRHIAMQVPDLERAARFYETVFEFKRVHTAESPIGNAIMLSDGTINLTFLNFPEGKGGQLNGPEWAGLHHFGIEVDDLAETKKRIEESGGRFFMTLPKYPGVDVEEKFKDPHGVVFDVADHDWHQAK